MRMFLPHAICCVSSRERARAVRRRALPALTQRLADARVHRGMGALMPADIQKAMTAKDLVNLLAFLSTLKKQ